MSIKNIEGDQRTEEQRPQSRQRRGMTRGEFLAMFGGAVGSLSIASLAGCARIFGGGEQQPTVTPTVTPEAARAAADSTPTPRVEQLTPQATSLPKPTGVAMTEVPVTPTVTSTRVEATQPARIETPDATKVALVEENARLKAQLETSSQVGKDRVQTITPTPKATEVATPVDSRLLESKELFWGDQDEFAIVFGDKPFGNRTAHTVIQIVRQARDGQGRPDMGADVKTTTLIFLEKGKVLRIPYEGLAYEGAEWKVWVPKDQVLFRMEGIAEEVRRRDSDTEIVDPYMLYVGDGDAPKGFTKDMPAWAKNWRVQVFPDITKPVSTPVSTPKAIEVVKSVPAAKPEATKVVTVAEWNATSEKLVRSQNGKLAVQANSEEYQVFQGWRYKSGDPNSTFQLVVEPGTSVEVNDDVEGTIWSGAGSKEQVAKRSLKMAQEKVENDKNKPVNQRVVGPVKTYWAGKTAIPSGLEKLPAGW